MDTTPALYDIRTMVVLRVTTFETSMKLNFWTVGQISKCFTIIWGRTRNATQWAPSQPSTKYRRWFSIVLRLTTFVTSIKPNFWAVGRITKCLTIIWGRTKNATQWAPSQPSTTYRRWFSIVLRSFYDLRPLKSQSQAMASKLEAKNERKTFVFEW